MARRIYRIDETQPNHSEGAMEVIESLLVRADTPAQAVRHVAQRFKCEVATQDDLVELAGKGVKVQEAGE